MEQKEERKPTTISDMKPMTEGAYGGGLYGKEEGEDEQPRKPPASETQSADGEGRPTNVEPKHRPPPSTGDRDVDITGQAYIQ
ncbi:uncharacterized protein [Aristolochia californica]|uniref:uncharacterized protein n=1 Tax=Aristolochia californica TaxID=171875 RepID=UPI0035D93C06